MSDIEKGRWRRLVRLASLGPRAAVAAVGGEEARRRAGGQMRELLGELKGGSQKLGQILAQVADALPEEAQAELAGLFADAEPLDWSEMEPVLTSQLPGWREQLEIEPVAMASASLGQVHRGRLRDGRQVAVKLQYPGVDEALVSDVENLRQLAAVGRVAAGFVDIASQVQEVVRGLRDELDYRKERERLLAMAAALDGEGDLVVPAPVDALCTERVLVTELLQGQPLAQVGLQAGQGGQLLRAVLLPGVRAGLLNADAHPGNFIRCVDGRLGLVDFGAVVTVAPARVRGVVTLMEALGAGAPDRVFEAFAGVELVLDRTRRQRRVVQMLIDNLGPMFAGPYDWSMDHSMAELSAYKLRHPLDLASFVPPPDLVAVLRAGMGVHHVLHTSGVQQDLREAIAALKSAAATQVRRG